jgi:putative ABC transport system substrate-binding protein
MRRREFLSFLSSAAAAWPFAARAQQKKLPVIGFLGQTTAETAKPWAAAFEQRLRELGWIDGRTVTIDYRWADGRTDRLAGIAGLAAEFVALKVDVILTYGTPAILAAKQATSDIPIVFALGANPVASGIVASLHRPGGNVTGLATAHSDVIGKRIELMREMDNRLRGLAIMANAGNTNSVVELREVQTAAHGLGLKTVPLEIRKAEEVVPAITAIKGQAEALYVVSDGLLNNERVALNGAALDARMSTMHGAREFVTGGGLMSYGASFVDLFRRSGDYVDKILKGTKPADIPVELPTKFDLVINLKTAKMLGLDIPSVLLARAAEVIE